MTNANETRAVSISSPAADRWCRTAPEAESVFMRRGDTAIPEANRARRPASGESRFTRGEHWCNRQMRGQRMTR